MGRALWLVLLLVVAMRVLIAVGNYVNVVDGVALTYARLVRTRIAAGDQIMVLGPGAARPRLEPSGKFVPVPSMPIPVQPEYRFALGIPQATRRAIEGFEPELVHVASPDLAGVAALDLAGAHGIPAVGSYHSEIARYLRHLPLGLLLERSVWAWVRRFYERCRHVYAPSEAMVASLRARGLRGDLRVWSRGVDAERFSPVHRDREFRAALGVGDDMPLVLFVARLRREKGLDTLVEVLARLARTGPPHVSAIAGDGPLRDSLRGRCPNTRFLGELDRAALARAYASADVFLYPSETETFGNVTLEAMASGLPTICADATGGQALVIPGETGELATPGDAAAFVDAITPLLLDAERRRTMGRAARARALQHDWDAAIEQLVGHWRQALPAPMRSPDGATGLEGNP
jgi:phosphatidylinositol alpha 1,6-mannosyltransferase